VLDREINSPTEFKQIIGRGTRINEEYGKTHFTILDFRSTTDHFADPDFDGDPVMIKQVSEDDDLSGVEDETTDEPITDILDGEEVEFPEPTDIKGGGDIVAEPRAKYYVNGVDVNIINERVQNLDANGKIKVEQIPLTGMTFMGGLRGDDSCPKSSPYNETECTEPDYRNPTERFDDPGLTFVSGSYFIITSDGNMNLKNPDDPGGPNTVQAVASGDGIVYADGSGAYPEGWYLVPGVVQGGGIAADILFDEASVTATENIVMAAVLAPGRTTIFNTACEPHVQDLCCMLNKRQIADIKKRSFR